MTRQLTAIIEREGDGYVEVDPIGWTGIAIQ